MDMISKLPPSIIETILCLLPIKEAVRTSILSREWRYHWIKIPKLVFIEDNFQVSTDRAVIGQMFDVPIQRSWMTKRGRLFSAIHQVLSMHEGPIHEFTLSMETDDSCVEIDQIIFRLSRKTTVKKLKLDFVGSYKLSLSLFSLFQLTDLYLTGCDLDHQPTFSGFGSLKSLFLQEVITSKKMLLHLLSVCPLLKTLDIKSSSIQDSDNSSIIDLFKCLHMIENLSICFGIIECFAQDGVPHELPIALCGLKHLCIDDICFIHKDGLPILVLLIKSSLNLEKLKLEILDDAWVEISERRDLSTLEDYSGVWLEHLNELEIVNMMYRKIELDFVKLVLAKSPVLKKVRILLYNEVAKDEELQISEILLCSPHTSPVVEIVVEIIGGSCTSSSRSVM